MWIDQWGEIALKGRNDGKRENITILIRQREARTLNTWEEVIKLDWSIEHLNFDFNSR